MYSTRFERPLILRPTEPRKLAAAAVVVWIPAAVLIAVAPIPDVASQVLAAWLVAAATIEISEWRRQPVRAIWRPRAGWSLEWPDGSRRSARLLNSSRICTPGLALNWTVAPTGRVRLVFLPGRAGATTLRRLRVVLRHGRADG